MDIDLLFEEFQKLKIFVAVDALEELSSVQKWVKFFSKNNAPNLSKICEFVFSLPVSNAMCERIFSLMARAWRQERNKLLISTLAAELIVKTNMNLSCNDFEQFLRTDDIGKGIVNAVGKSDKY